MATEPEGPKPVGLMFLAVPTAGGYNLILVGGGFQIPIAEALPDMAAVVTLLGTALTDLLSVPDRLQEFKDAMEDLGPKVNEIMDVQNVHDENSELLDRRLAQAESKIGAIEKRGMVPTRPIIPAAARPMVAPARTERGPYRVGQGGQPRQPIRRAPAPPGEYEDEPVDFAVGDTVDLDQPVERQPPARARRIPNPTPGHPAAVPPPDRNAIAYEGQAPEFSRGTVQPHVPVGGVTRGPGSQG